MDENQPLKYLPATALLCTLDKMQPSPLKSLNFFFGQSTNLTAIFHGLCEHEFTNSSIIYPIHHITLLKTEISSEFSRSFDIRSLLPCGREVKKRKKEPEDVEDEEVDENLPPRDPHHDSKCDKPPYSKTSRQPQSQLTAQNLLHSSTSGSSRRFGSCSTNAQISLSHQEVSVGPPSNHLRSPNSVSDAATPPSYRAASRLPTQPGFVPNQSPAMATSAPKYRPSSPQITPRPPAMTRFRRYFID
jgi:hypothetical protein